MIKKKKGSTLIEIIVVISMFLILASIPITSKMYSGIADEITMKSIKHDISNILSLSKQYCYYTGNNGRLKIDKIAGKIIFLDAKNQLIRKEIATVTLPKGYKFANSFDINVSNNGVIASTTIEIYDKSNNRHKITIAAGNDLITIY